MFVVLANDNKSMSTNEFIKEISKNRLGGMPLNYKGDYSVIKPYDMILFEINDVNVYVHKLTKQKSFDDVVYSSLKD